MNIWKTCSERKDYEKLVYLLRADLIVLVRPIILFTILFSIPFIVRYIFALVAPTILNSSHGALAFTVYRGAYLLFILVFALTAFYDYYLDVWIVTNERIVDIQLKGLFARTVSETRLYRIQDVKSNQKGIFATVFNYGNVHVQTAGAQENFLFDSVPDPVEIAQGISRLVEHDRPFHTEKVNALAAETGGTH